MGNWNISIRGVGPHHNGRPDIDADAKARNLVADLVAAGHIIDGASFTYGAAEDIVSGTEMRVESGERPDDSHPGTCVLVSEEEATGFYSDHYREPSDGQS